MEQLRQDAVARYRGLLVKLVDIAVSRTDDTLTAASAVLDAMCRTLHVSDGSLSLVDDTNTVLETASNFGAHASLMGSTPPVPVTSDYESARVFRDGVPLYSGQHYGESEGYAEGADGAARWKSGISVQASAVLPLVLGGRRIGTLSLGWSAPQDFDETMRELLEALASLAALAIEHARCAAPEAQPTTSPNASAEGLELTARFEVTAEGVMVPRPLDARWSGHEVVRLGIRARAQDLQETAFDAFMLADGRMVAVVMRLAAGWGASVDDAVFGVLRHTARVLSDRADGPAEVITRLNEAAATLGSSGAVVDAWLGTFDTTSAALEWCATGDSETLLFLADDRIVHAPRCGPPIGSSPNATYDDQLFLLVPGDILAVSMGGHIELKLELVGLQPPNAPAQ